MPKRIVIVGPRATLMRRSEEAVDRFLRGLEVGDVRFEPDGNVPPDFLVDERIAVEARRLNQNELLGNGYRGLEVKAATLQTVVAKVLKEQGPPPDDSSWFVFYSFSRPLPDWRQLERLLRGALADFKAQVENPPGELRVAPGCRLEFDRASQPHSSWFVPGGSVDHDAGGFTVAELITNLSICIEEKARKVEPYLSRYAEWWLAFEDTIAYGDLDDDELAELTKHVAVDHPFARVILVSPVEPHSGRIIFERAA